MENTLESPRRSDQPVLKEVSPEYSLEGLMLKLKLHYFGHLMQRAEHDLATFTGPKRGSFLEKLI